MSPLLHPVFVRASDTEAEPSNGASASRQAELDVPIGVIVGATIAGMVLAIAMMMVWAYYSKTLKRRQARDCKEASLLAATKDDTLQNTAGIPSIRSHSRIPSALTRPSSGKVTFSTKSKGGKASCDMQEKQLGCMTNLPEPSLPKPLRPVKSIDHTLRSVSYIQSYDSRHARPLLTKSIMHKPSTVSSASWYSTESGEERLSRPPASLIRAAFSRMGNGVDNAVHRHSTYSNISDQRQASWQFLWSSQAATQASRVSQATSGSAYSQTDEGGQIR